MSKYLVKILSICALVVLLAVTVVGSAICVSEAVGCTLTVVDASEVYEGAETGVAIYIDGKKQEKNSVHLSKYTEVEVVYTGEESGYKFKGWYEGNYNVNKDKALSDKTSYKFEVKKNTKLSAVSNLRRITVEFEGFMADGETPVTIESGDYIFGQELPKLPSSESKYFQGWQIATEDEVQNAQIFNYAIFENEKVTVKPVWAEQEYLDYTINIAYKAGSDIVDTIIYNTGLKEYSYVRERVCYNLVGVEFDGKVYKYNAENAQFIGLGDAVAMKGILEVDATAVWECDYDSFIFAFDAVAEYVHPDFGLGEWAVYANKIGSLTPEYMEYTMRAFFNNSENENYFDIEDVATELLLNQYQNNYQTVDGKEVEMTGDIKISVDEGSSIIIKNAGELTFRNIIVGLEEALEDQGKTIDAGKPINVTFICNVK